ncbi:hypothetical protein WAX86_20285 (plasmid) [Photobacterium damselae subsp. damselae]|uniref:hypothetical protein n=1 Tax=Photobacterium damselae TaxID=38293 RepID=UPI00311AC3FF
MGLPTNNAKTNSELDQGLLSQQELDSQISEYKTKDELAQKVLSAKTPQDYKKLIDTNFNAEPLLELLESDNSRTTILLSSRLSPSDYAKLKRILDSNGIELKAFLSNSINQEYENI